MYAFAPNGSQIIGTLERVSARAEIDVDTFVKKDGKLLFDFAGGTEIFWDDQYTVTRKGEVVFLADDGSEWTESEIFLSESEDWEPEQESAA